LKNPYQSISPFITNNYNHRHSGFFAIFRLYRSVLRDNAKKTGIQIGYTSRNVHIPSYKKGKNNLSLFSDFRRWIPVFSPPGTPFDTYPFFTAKNRNDPLILYM